MKGTPARLPPLRFPPHVRFTACRSSSDEGRPAGAHHNAGRTGIAVRRPGRWFCFLLLWILSVPASVHAQVPDTARVAPDTVQVAPDTVRVPPGVAQPDSLATPVRSLPVGFAEAGTGLVLGDTLPIRRPVLEATALLRDVPGTFVYAFGTAGWPEGWSPFGLPPHQVALLLNGVPFHDLLTGRPHYDLVPLAYVGPLRLEAGRLHAPVAVHASLRAFDNPRPLTELRYLRGGEGLQSIDAFHMQRRRLSLFGQPGTIQIVGAYSGRAADGAYPGSRLDGARQTMALLRYEQPRWSAEVMNLHTRWRVGAHGGVIPSPADDYDTIYRTTLADVLHPEAERRTVRNDLAATVRVRLWPGRAAPLTGTAYWTRETFRYRDALDTLSVPLDRFGVRVYQDLGAGPHRLRLRLEGWFDVPGRSPAVPDRPGRGRLHAAVTDSLQLGGAVLLLEGGVHAYGGTIQPGAAVRWSRPAGSARVFASGTLAGMPDPWIVTSGFGGYVQPAAGVPAARTALAGAGVALRSRALDATVFGFVGASTDPHDLFATARTDTVEVLVATTPVYRVGAAADLGWRRTAGRGFYATVQPAVVRLLNAGASPIHDRLAESLPAAYVRGRLGLRYLLFRGDLDLDLSLRGHAWTSLRSRTLQPQTGLLVLPPAGSRTFGPSGTLDVLALAGVRTATFFLAYENILSGTALMPGTLLVPDYPLPARRMRFGVYWPITD